MLNAGEGDWFLTQGIKWNCGGLVPNSGECVDHLGELIINGRRGRGIGS